MKQEIFETQVKQVLDNLPVEYAERLENLVFLIEDRADGRMLADLGFEHPDELLGFYDGTPLTERTHDQIDYGPDRIYLFRRAIEAEARISELSIERVIRETVWHEIAHYFGFSEEEMDRIEESWANSER